MTTRGFTLFETAIGRCGIAWSGRGVAAVHLPEARETQTRARLLRRFPGARETAPPIEMQRAIDSIAALLRGEANDLSGIPLDMDGVPPFHRRVYEVARGIPPGATASYGALAARLGAPGAARAVGQALGRNPFAIVVPCHRVLAAGGRAGGFSASGGVATKLRILSIEGTPLAGAPRTGAPAARPPRRDAGGPGPPTDDAPRLFDDEPAFGFDPDIAVRRLRAADPALARVIDAVGPFRMELDPTPSLFVALAEAIVYQQLHGKAAAAIFARVRALFPGARDGPTAGQILRASDARLRGAGLSRPKILSLRDLARRTVAGELPALAEVRRMEDEAIIERLIRVRGIGRWTAEMLLIFHLGRPDVLPVDDYGVRKGLAVALRKRAVPAPKDVARRGARWRPYRTVASWYLWRAAERGKI